ncbi:MAG: hypothetical protein Q8M74_00315 [Chloroflexota bacterium]|nr:hypothetical protein [Chloroflexota bacterium]
MINRVAIFAASIVAALALAAGLVIAGLGPGSGAADLQPVSAPVVATTDAPAPLVQVDTVYVEPASTPQDIVVTKVVKAASHGDDDGNEDEGSDD